MLLQYNHKRDKNIKYLEKRGLYYENYKQKEVYKKPHSAYFFSNIITTY